MLPSKFVYTILLSLLAIKLSARKIEHILPFKLVGTNIIVEVQINTSTSLNFIFDTGVRHTIITELYENDTVNLNYAREIPLSGLGTGDPVLTYLSTNNQLTASNVHVDSIRVYALKTNIFQLSRHLGTKINGLIGYDLIKNHVVKIDYINKKITFYSHDNYRPPARYTSLPLTIRNQKPYINASVLLDKQIHHIDLLIDTGAELSLWLVSSSFKNYQIPQNSVYTFIGQGLNGEIFGSVARIKKAYLAKYSFENPIVAFPDSASIKMVIANHDRDGTIGSEILRRFHLIFNYRDSILYLKRNTSYGKKFTYNTTGIEIIQPYYKLPIFEVAELWEKSPAAEAGLKIGDRIESIDYNTITNQTLIEVKEMLRKNSGSIRMVISRKENNQLIKKKVRFDLYKL